MIIFRYSSEQKYLYKILNFFLLDLDGLLLYSLHGSIILATTMRREGGPSIPTLKLNMLIFSPQVITSILSPCPLTLPSLLCNKGVYAQFFHFVLKDILHLIQLCDKSSVPRWLKLHFIYNSYSIIVC